MDAGASEHSERAIRFPILIAITCLALLVAFIGTPALADTASSDTAIEETTSETAALEGTASEGTAPESTKPTEAVPAISTSTESASDVQGSPIVAATAQDNTGGLTTLGSDPIVNLAGTSVVDGKNITYWLNDGAGGITSTGATATNYNVKFDPTGATVALTLNSARIKKFASGSQASLTGESGLYTDTSLNIILEGENTMNLPATKQTASVAIYGIHDLAFSGTGSLSVSSGHAASRSYCISTPEGITIGTGVTIAASAWSTDDENGTSYGISGATITLQKGCDVTAIGNTSSMRVAPSIATHDSLKWYVWKSSTETTAPSGTFTSNVNGTSPYAWSSNDRYVRIKPSEAVTGITLNKTTMSLPAGRSGTIKATVIPKGATDPTVTWTTNDSAVATVVGGKVKAVSAGTATITATTKDGGYAASCTVTVADTPIIAGTCVANGSNVTYWLNDGVGGITSTGATATNYNVKYDPANAALALKGLSVSKTYDYDGLDAGICIVGNLTVILEGNNTITLPNTISSWSAGVYQVAGILTLAGTGTLEASGGALTDSSATSGTTYGIRANNLLLSDSVTLKGIGGDASAPQYGYSYGVTTTEACTVEAGTTLEGEGGAGLLSIGLGDLFSTDESTALVVRGTATGTGQTGNVRRSYGVIVTNITIGTGGNLVGEGRTARELSGGIFSTNTFTLDEGGTAKGISGDLTGLSGEAEAYYVSAGIDFANTTISGTATGQSGNALENGYSFGVSGTSVLVTQTGYLEGKSTNTSEKTEYSIGINNTETLTIAGKAVAKAGVASERSSGIDCGDEANHTEGILNIQEGASVTADAGACSAAANGIYVTTALNIAGGKLTATGDTGALNMAPNITAARYAWKSNTTTAEPATALVNSSVTPYVWDASHNYLRIDKAQDAPIAPAANSTSATSTTARTGDDIDMLGVILAFALCSAVFVLRYAIRRK